MYLCYCVKLQDKKCCFLTPSQYIYFAIISLSVNIGKPSTGMNSIIGTKMGETFPGAATVHLNDPTSPNVRSSANQQHPSNLLSSMNDIPAHQGTIDLHSNKVVINLIIVGLFFWSIVIILVVYVFVQSRGPSKGLEAKAKVTSRQEAPSVCTSVAIENPYASQRKSFVERNKPELKKVSFPSQSKPKVSFPKSQPDEEEQYDTFKTKVGLDKPPAMYMYSLMPEDIEFNLYAQTFEDHRTLGDTRETQMSFVF